MISNLLSFLELFGDEQRCIDYLKKMRWNDQPVCPFCKCQKIYEFSDRKTFKCSECLKRFSVKVGTIFQSSQIPLKKWFLAIYFVANNKKGIASTQLSEDIGVTQKTAWFMLQRIRHSCFEQSADFLNGIIEVDETFIGGKEKNKPPHRRTKGTQGRSTKTKSAVVGLLQRGGNLRLHHAVDVKGKTVRTIVAANVMPGSAIMTDEFHGYKALKDDYHHQSINHSKGEYGRGEVTTNAVEGAFSLLKRGIIGIYHKISEKHLIRYLDEFAFRYNARNFAPDQRFALLINRCGVTMQYNQLIA